MKQTLLRSAVRGSAEFDAELDRLARRGESDLLRVESAVREILEGVRSGGDSAVRRFIERFEARQVGVLYQRDYGGSKALAGLPTSVRDAMTSAADRIRRYHERQAEQQKSFEYTEQGVTLGSRVVPLSRVGVYAPGGKANYPSSVLMSVIPARVAGVGEIVLASPDPSAEVRAACQLAGVHAVLDAGGAQAVAALAYGTESVGRVDKIVGPGNIYVAAAKRLVFGEVAIDSIAGPSEILVIADGSADPRVVAADLLSQAEHDEAAYPLLVCTSAAFVSEVSRELHTQLSDLPKREIAAASVQNNGFALVVGSRAELVEVANRLAAEHVSVQTQDPRELADGIRHAGAIFIGAATPEAAGDYMAGPSHVLPTGGAARYSAPLGVYDFVARTSLIGYEPGALAAQAHAITTLARVEGLEAHARAVEVRTGSKDRSQ